MSRPTFKAALLAAILGGSVLSPAWADSTTQEAPAPGHIIENQYIVTLAPNITDVLGVNDLTTAIRTLLAGIGGGDVLFTYQHALTGMTVQLTDLQASLLGVLPGVLAIEPDRAVTAVATQNNATWGLDRVDQPLLPLDNRFQYPDSGGQDVTVYVVDTGLRSTHNDFAGRVSPGRNFVSTGGFLFGGGSIDPADTEDCNGHGTHVAGTAVGTTWGVAKQANIAPVRVLGCNGSGSNSGVIAGVDWVAGNHRKPAVANLSLGGTNSTALDTAVRNAINAGVTMVVAAGNDNVNACNGSPNRVAEALTVGATTREDRRSSFSNYGACVDLFAPGSDITSAWYQSDTQTASLNGTSMAAPHAAGAAALYLAANPSASPSAVNLALVNDAVTGVIGNAGSQSPNRLLQITQQDGSGIDRLPTAAFSADCQGTVCSLDASGSTDDVAVAAWDWTLGDGNVASGEQISHDYGADGEFTITLTVTDTANQTGSTEQTVTVGSETSPCPDCTRYEGQLNGGSSVVLPSNGFSYAGGPIDGWLQSPAGATFTVTLQSQSCFLFFCSWNNVASASPQGGMAEIHTNVGSGVYRWQVSAQSGSGTYTLLTNP
ncbi:peptidase S8 and S53, subtilisin, kexin, sedolisin [Alcanivorax sp. MD8A]|uniref:S8 family serine peptidase n=1 Tax=Alcanivorax sp. MD8A TaxID=1177157 RepID=UPI000C9B1788|nr:S8 family serine peptidase [Alcanivorax sp. MD8A]PNE03661.1 peptidase S8 and S53, subtilisin, kexin, sedolisin [Alcanivorax sp. MD8A]